MPISSCLVPSLRSEWCFCQDWVVGGSGREQQTNRWTARTQTNSKFSFSLALSSITMRWSVRCEPSPWSWGQLVSYTWVEFLDESEMPSHLTNFNSQITDGSPKNVRTKPKTSLTKTILSVCLLPDYVEGPTNACWVDFFHVEFSSRGSCFLLFWVTLLDVM